MATKKKVKAEPVVYQPGTKVMYAKHEYEVVEQFGKDYKYAVLFGNGKRISVETKMLEKV